MTRRSYSRQAARLAAPFDAEGMRGQTLNSRPCERKDGEVVAEAGAKMTPRRCASSGDEKVTGHPCHTGR